MKKLFLLIVTIGLYNISGSQEIYFPPTTNGYWETIDPASLGWNTQKIQDLHAFLDETNTKAFLILKNGKIAFEAYFDDFTKDSIWNWASAAKPLTGFLTGIAQEKGLLSIHDQVSDYLGVGWTTAPAEKEELIKIIHQLSMTTGLQNAGSPYCIDPQCLKYKADAGTRWEYCGETYHLLTDVISIASGQDYNTFNEQVLLSKIGMNGLWQIDNGYLFFSSTARSMARFGLLLLNDGVWADETILGDHEYLEDSRKPSQDYNKAYGYFWWLNGQPSYMLPYPDFQTVFTGSLLPNGPADTYMGIGRKQQLLYIVPSQGLVIVRMGAQPPYPLPINQEYLQDLWDKIDMVVSVKENVETIVPGIQIFPNPANAFFEIDFGDNIPSSFHLILYNAFGQTVLRQKNELMVEIGALKPGIYFLEARMGDKKIIRRLMVQ